jgi:trigger factor
VSVAEREPIVKLDATVPLSPEATLSDYADIRVDEQVEAVTDEQVEESVSRLQEANATWEATDRPVAAGDLVIMTAKATVDGEPFVDQSEAEYLADPENPNPVPGFAAALVGIEIGGSKSFSLEIPEDFRNSKFAGKTARFEVSVISTKAKVLPELTDDLVKGLGEGLNTVADLRIRIRENLEARAEQALKESLEEKVIDELVGRTTFELSPILIEHEAEHILHDQQHALARYNISFEQYLAQTGQSTDGLIAGAKDSAEKRLKRTLVMDRLAEAEKIEPSDDEIAAEIELWKAQGEGEQPTDYDSEESRKAVATVLRRRKAMERAIEIARSGPTGATKTGASAKKRKTAASKTKKQDAAAEAEAEEEKSEA